MKHNSYIDTGKFSRVLRQRGINIQEHEILITRFDGSKQAEDMTLSPNCRGYGRIHHFRRFQGEDWPSNPLPMDPASHSLNLPHSDEIQAQVFQNAICSWRCWYCFVDFSLLSANPTHSEYKTVQQLLDLYLKEPNRPKIVDLSGGQPDLVPEWGLWFADAIHEMNLEKEVYLWTDDNLSNDYLWRYLSAKEIQRLSSYPNYGRVGCFKGFDERSFSFNTNAPPEMFSTQFRLMRRLIENRFDVYGYVTFTSNNDKDLPGIIGEFVDRLQMEVHPLFPLRTIPLHIKEFTPTKTRMKPDHFRALEIQKVAALAWQEELGRRFPIETRRRNIYQHILEPI